MGVASALVAEWIADEHKASAGCHKHEAKECRNSFEEAIPWAPGPINCSHGDGWVSGLFNGDKQEAGAAFPVGLLARWRKASVTCL